MRTEISKKFIRKALEEYASFFRNMADGNLEHSSQDLQRLKATDKEAEFILSSEEISYYRTRRTQLMRLFRKRLVSDLKGQVEKEIVDQVEELVSAIDETVKANIAHQKH